jgi:hypothetical protein
MGWIAYLLRNVHLPFGLDGIILIHVVFSKINAGFKGPPAYFLVALFVPLGQVLPLSSRTPYFIGVILFVVRVPVQLKEWILCDGPPEEPWSYVFYGFWCVGSYVATTLVCFHIWPTPGFLYGVISVLWKSDIGITAVILFTSVLVANWWVCFIYTQRMSIHRYICISAHGYKPTSR